LAVNHAHRAVPDVVDRPGDLGLLDVHRRALALGDMHGTAAEDGRSRGCGGDFC